jgi:hypothetical protein
VGNEAVVALVILGGAQIIRIVCARTQPLRTDIRILPHRTGAQRRSLLISRTRRKEGAGVVEGREQDDTPKPIPMRVQSMDDLPVTSVRGS